MDHLTRLSSLRQKGIVWLCFLVALTGIIKICSIMGLFAFRNGSEAEIVGYHFLPKRFPPSTTLLLLMFSMTVASMFDNTLGAAVFDFYDIMDGPRYTGMDFVAYFLYAPIGYFFIYVYDYLALEDRKLGLYILAISLASIGYEWTCVKFGVFHYKNGYHIYYSLPVYLLTQAGTIRFYKYIKQKPEEEEERI